MGDESCTLCHQKEVTQLHDSQHLGSIVQTIDTNVTTLVDERNSSSFTHPITSDYHGSWGSDPLSCEGCHGPASQHIVWSLNDPTLPLKGFVLSLKHDSSHPSNNYTEVTLCATCHSKHLALDDKFKVGDSFDDHYLLVDTIEAKTDLYHSFLESKMYQEGVRCSDCHNPHTLKLKADGNALCYQCHSSQKYSATTHHFHETNSTGSSCIACHMTTRNDHSFSVPRPHISIDTPQISNACNMCHKDKRAQWASDSLIQWYGNKDINRTNFAYHLQALRTHSKDALFSLELIINANAPMNVKIKALPYLGTFRSQKNYKKIMQMLKSPNPKIRRASLQALEAYSPKMRIKKTFEMLNDPMKSVRMEASRQLSTFSLGKGLTQQQHKRLEKAFGEYEKILLFNSNDTKLQLQLADFYKNQNRIKEAIKAYDRVLYLNPKSTQGYIHYAHFLLKQKKAKEAFEILNKGLKQMPQNGLLYHALGLWYVEQKEHSRAIETLEKAYHLEQKNSHFAYVYAVAVAEHNTTQAIQILEKAYQKEPDNEEILEGLIYYSEYTGDLNRTKKYEKKFNNL